MPCTRGSPKGDDDCASQQQSVKKMVMKMMLGMFHVRVVAVGCPLPEAVLITGTDKSKVIRQKPVKRSGPLVRPRERVYGTAWVFSLRLWVVSPILVIFSRPSQTPF